MVEVGCLVDTKKGLISRKIFADREIYEQELDRIFGRCWLYLAHESQIPDPGDFVTTYMGEESILVVRNASGKVNAFLNTCRHRGNRICRADQGNTATFTCSYHAWTYDTDGRLVSVPYMQDAYGRDFAPEEWGLAPVPQVDSYKGLIFGTLDSEAPSLRAYLGDMAWYLDFIVDRYEGGIEVIGGVQRWVMPANWKFAAENFAGDSYHISWTHLSALRSGFGGRQAQDLKLINISLDNGHNLMAAQLPIYGVHTPEPQSYLEQRLPETERRLGKAARSMTPLIGTVFPNVSFMGALSRSIRVWHPRGPDKMEVWAWCIVDKSTPDEIKETVRLNYLRRFGPAGGFELDDVENWQMCTQAGKGWMADRYPFNYQMRLGQRESSEMVRGAYTHDMSESNQRNFYDHWAKVMNGNEWSDVMRHAKD